MAPALTHGWIVLTMGDRPKALNAAIESIRAADPNATVTVVMNGTSTNAIAHDGDTEVVLPTNIGVPAGRNAGMAATDTDLLVFLDDDATVDEDFDARRLSEMFVENSDLAVISFAVRDPASGAIASRHVPRVGGRKPNEGGTVTAFLGGACCIRRAAVTSTDGYWDVLFYAHEETDLAWRLQDRGWRVMYEPAFVVSHPTAPGTEREPTYWRREMRNRVLIARRNLPAGIGVFYVATWLLISGLRAIPSKSVAHTARGFIDGLRTDVPNRSPIRLRTAWRLTLRGRPPVI